MAANSWTITPSSSVGGAFVVAVSGAKYILSDGLRNRSLYWGGAGISISVPGLPGSVSVSTPKHWVSSGKIYFSRLAPHRLNKFVPVEQVFNGNGIILEVGANNAMASILGLQPLIRDLARAQGIQDWENEVSGQMLLFNTTNNIVGTLLGTSLGDLLGILAEIGLSGEFSSIYTQAVAFVASTSSGVDTSSANLFQGAWFLP